MLQEIVFVGKKAYKLGGKVKILPNPIYKGTVKQVVELDETVFILKIEDKANSESTEPTFDLITRYGEILVGFTPKELKLVVTA